MAKSGMSESDVESQDGKKKDIAEANSKEESTSTDPNYIIQKPIKPTTSLSIMVQALIKNFCGVYQSNESNAEKLYQMICSKLHNMNVIDESYRMNEFEGIRNQYQRAFHHLLSSPFGDGKAVQLRPMWPNNDITNEWSHYNREFEEVSFIAGGGFGKVYRVKHKLDGTEYAVKKITLRSAGIESVRNYLSEVKTFASLNHSNIVQYKAAWLEQGAAPTKSDFDHPTNEYYNYTSDTDPFSSTSSNEEPNKQPDPLNSYIYPEATNLNSIEFIPRDDTSDFQVDFEQSRHISYSNGEKKKRRVKRSSISEGGNAICTLEEIKRLQKPRAKWATLYIQMSLCQSTLKQWLETRNSERDKAIVPVYNQHRTRTVMEILRQLLKGLQYIHYKGIVHHDIKPSNIFMQRENDTLLVQLGDFGLACPLQSSRHCLALGTKLYAAPEQLSGICNPKSDMYSLGIVVFELTETFRTEMEKVSSINELCKGNLSETICNNQPELAKIIKELVVRDPNSRPEAADLLNRINVDVFETEKVRDLQSKLAEKDEKIKRLMDQLEKAGIAIT